ncbi:hypothetical protein HOE04_04840 [archaeon]|jgi:hypothetical protein|nr:hypothetical protein [archaeon]
MAIKNKLLGYAIAGLGLAGLALPSFNILPNIPKIYLTIPALILIAIGVMMLITSGSGKSKNNQSQKEVPIYKGKEIVGYRVED